MATLKQTLRTNQKYLFWGGTALVVVVGLVCWFLSTKSLASVYTTRKGAIEGTYNKGLARTKINPHPNTITISAAGKSVNEAKRNVLAAWKTVYDAQKKAIYVWPTTGLTPEFQEAVKKLALDYVKNPTDKEKADDPDKIDIRLDLREQFPKYIRGQFQKLVELVDAQWFKDQDDAGRAGHGAAAATQTREFRVEWPDQKKIQSHFEMTATPSTLQILYLQEDLWVYQAFCDIIKKLNAGSKGRHDASIWVIQALDIGPSGVESSPGGEGENRVIRGQGAAGSKEDTSSKGAAPPPAAGEASPDDGLKSGRYVALNGRPLSAAEMQAPPTEDKKYLLQYRLMPFKLKLLMDARKVDDLLVELHNAMLPIEVREVRLNPGAKPGEERADQKKISPFATAVEVRGVIYLANPPDTTLLKTDEAAAEGSPDAAPTKPAAKPVETPPASGPPSGDAPGKAAPTDSKPVDGNPSEGKAADPKPEEAASSNSTSSNSTSKSPM